MQFSLAKVVVIAIVTLAIASLTACSGDPQFIQVTAGRYLTCALRSDGSVVCWGEDSSTQLRVPAEERFTAIETGGFHTCGLREDGTAVCWSDYDLNALSRAGKILPFPPEDVPFSAIEVSQDLTCAVRMDGTSSCWDLWQEFSPLGMEKVVAIGAAIQAACGLRSDGRLVCSNSYLADHFEGEELVAISTSQSILCGLGSDGSVSCLAFSDLVLAEEGPFSAVAASLHQVCALRQEGTVVCWELFPNLIGTTISPWLIDAPLADSLEEERFTAISAGLWHVCGLRRDGGISCWGFDNEGQALPPLDYSE